MKRMPHLKFFFCLVMLTITFASCKSDDEGNEPSLALIGVWQRSDASDLFEIQLSFHNDNSGSLMSFSRSRLAADVDPPPVSAMEGR